MTTLHETVRVPPKVIDGAATAAAVATTVSTVVPRFRLVRDLIALIRPHQWAKNLLVVPLALIDGAALHPRALLAVAWALLGFTLASATVYIFNDIADRHRDRAHPTKRERPIASGRVGVPLAAGFGALVAGALIAVVLTGPAIAWWPLALYLVLNVAYSRGLKNVPLLDVFVVALGFVLRLVQGYLAAAVPVESWLLIAIFALCLLLILGKRRHEVSAGGVEHRPSLSGYSPQYLEYMIVLCAVLTVSAFLFYVDDAFPAPYTTVVLLGSVPFALFALARYLQVVIVDGGGGEPVRVLLRDRVMLINSALWAVLFAGTLLAVQFPALFGSLTG